MGRRRIVLLGYALYAGIDLWLVVASSRWESLPCCRVRLLLRDRRVAEQGLHHRPRPERRATAVGVYNFVTGVLYLPASLVAGMLWAVSPNTAFAVSAALSVAAMAIFLLMRSVADGAR